MPTINALSSVDSLASGDQFPIYDASNGDARKVSASALLTFFQSNFASPDVEVQITAPTSSGFNLQMTASTDSIWAIVNPTGAFAAATITLPPVADAFDGQEILVTCSQAITALTVDGNGATVVGGPTTLGAGGFFSLRYRASQTTWYTTSQSLGSLYTLTDPVIIGKIYSSDNEAMFAFSQAGGGTAVNYPSVTYSISGTKVTYTADGSDTNITLQLGPKGSGDLRMEADTGGAIVGGATVSAFATTGDINLTADAGDVVLAATAGVIDIQNRAEFATAPRLTVTTVGNLPIAPLVGMIAIVNDATATTQNSVVAGTGANSVVVFYDGTNWRIA